MIISLGVSPAPKRAHSSRNGASEMPAIGASANAFGNSRPAMDRGALIEDTVGGTAVARIVVLDADVELEARCIEARVDDGELGGDGLASGH